jgi:PAS domain S-box-containing protein
LRESQQRSASIYNTVEDVIFHLAIEPEAQFRIVSVNAAFLRLTGLSRVGGKTVSEVIPEPSFENTDRRVSAKRKANDHVTNRVTHANNPWNSIAGRQFMNALGS